MMRTCGAMMAAGGLLMKGAVGLAGFILVVGSIVPRTPESASRTGADKPGRAGQIVVLEVPEGRPAGHLTVVDASGRLLASLSHWDDGRSVIVTPRGAGPSVGCYHGAEGTVGVLVSGDAGEVQIDIDRDGRTEASAREEPPFINPPMSSRGPEKDSRSSWTNASQASDDEG